jgi:radical SAM superfamily enzyme YgiQ (UPF0313 family)
MRRPGDLLLVSCYELGHQPFQLASLCAMLQQVGYSPMPVDTSVEALSDEAILQARFVAISVPMHTALRLGHQVAQRVRRLNPAAHICLYGLYALLNADYLLRGGIDSAIGGEYEAPLLNLVAAVEEGTDIAIAGVATRRGGSKAWLARTPFVVPERGGLPALERYARLETNGTLRLAGYTESTRGCKHTCLHCPITPIYGGRFFAVPLAIVMADIRAQVELGAGHITFGDPDFFNGPGHALRICRALHQEFPTLSFDATIKIEHLLRQRQLLPQLQELGCAFIVSAVESLNDDVLRNLDKGHSGADVAAAFDLMQEAGITLRPSLLPFTPWETLDSYLQLLTFFEQRSLLEQVDPVHYSIRLLVPPGSSMLASAQRDGWLGELDETAYTYRWRHSDRRMDELQWQVSAVAERAAAEQQDPVATFFRIKALALSARGERVDNSRAAETYAARQSAPPPPRLTEAWFC